MTFLRSCAALAAFATTALLFATPASAQATRTWVSGVGDDANPCSRTAPCKTFAGAISKTATGGEIECLDPGGFGALTITKAITIDCRPAGGIGGVLVAGTNGLVINITSGDNHVQLIGLDIDGLGANGTTSIDGINVLSAANVSVIDCLIYGFTNSNGTDGNGIRVASSNAKVFVENSIIRQNTNGVKTASSGAAVQIDHSVLDSNITANLVVSVAGSVAILNDTTIGSSPTAISNSGTVFSFGNNAIRGPISGTAITPQALQ